jgi:undecaprenyl pyrophosphate phosphatase UppP
MKILRSILAVAVGAVVSIVVIFGMEMANFIVYRPNDGKSISEKMTEMKEDPQAAKAFIESLPTSAMVAVVVAWVVGAFLGGGVSAWIAGRWQVLHAGIIGAVVLAGVVVNSFQMKSQYDFSHPDWMIVAGLLLPLPVSLLAGKIVSMLLPPSPASASNP